MSILYRHGMMYQSKIETDDNYALAFWNKGQSGTNAQKINLTGFSAATFSETFTIELRHRLTSFDGSYPGLFSVHFGSGSFIQAFYLSNNTIIFRWLFTTPNNGTNRRNITRAFTINNWHHMVFTFEKNVRGSLWVNGVKTELLTDVSIVSPDTLVSSGMFLSGDNNGYNSTGFARGVRIFEGYAATPTDVASLYNSTASVIQPVPVGMQPYLVRDLRLNQKRGRKVLDQKGTSSNLLHNNALAYTNLEVLEGGGAWVDLS